MYTEISLAWGIKKGGRKSGSACGIDDCVAIGHSIEEGAGRDVCGAQNFFTVFGGTIEQSLSTIANYVAKCTTTMRCGVISACYAE